MNGQFSGIQFKNRIFCHLGIPILLFLFCSLPAVSQDSVQVSLGAGFGASNFHMTDEHATPLFFRGTGIAPSLNYTNRNSRRHHDVDGSFYDIRLTTTAGNYKTDIIGGRLRYSYFRSLHPKYGIYAGLSATSLLIKSDYKFYLQTFWAKAIESWYWSHSIDLAVKFSARWNKKNEYAFRLFVPVVSNSSRPAYSSSGDYNYEKNDWQIGIFGKTAFVFANPINLDMTYTRSLNDHFSLNLKYEFCFSQNHDPEWIRLYMNNLSAGINYNF